MDDNLVRWAEQFQRWLWNRLTWEWFFLGAIAAALLVTSLITGKPPWEWASGGGSPGSKPGSRCVVAVEEDRVTISPVFARAPIFLLIENGKVVQAVRNPYRTQTPAGGPAAELVAGWRPSHVVAGDFGPVAEKFLRDRGIQPVRRTGKVHVLLGHDG